MSSDSVRLPDPKTHRASARAKALIPLAVRGLAASYVPDTAEFVQTMRLHRTDGSLRQEGRSLRYAAIAALGLARAGRAASDDVLRGPTLEEFTRTVARRALDHPDPGAVALAAWAVAEVLEDPHTPLLDRLLAILTSEHPLATVDTAWMLTAAVAAGRDDLSVVARARLLDAQGTDGIFPHAIPARSLGRWRSHVGSFADQVYPIQALARFAGRNADAAALAAANRTAARLCDLQGSAGQWWWHYDARDGSVVEGYPVYSVHQHGMAPMVLADLATAGGDDHSDSVDLGVDWLAARPESTRSLVSQKHSMIWRKIGRREPAKFVRKASAVTTSLRAGFHLPALDTLFAPGPVDHECRPYELAWLLYAWAAPAAKESK
ncbi:MULTISPECIES: hypothetical protein [unclassified Diaminobutyricimonas]|uniref:hypothetical protein n=1 Tax=unclassified Diaminobutyricimonas TaxID=2643261 RepID=UPI0012F4C560|nr:MULTISPECIES: hypothetical protein [unclassified Diaminobutyricimonas]